MIKILPLSFISALVVATESYACDICSSYTPSTADVLHGESGMHVSIFEQFTRFGSLRLDGNEVANPTDQYLNSSTTQIIVGKSFFDNRLNLQANLPLIHREFSRPEGFSMDEGTESGLGDISLLARYELFRYEPSPKDCATDCRCDLTSSRNLSFSATVFGGIKLPTGDSSRLKEELDETEVVGAPESGIHGHDLALGSGSVDGLVGADLYARYGNWFFQGEIQYAIRSEGDYSYRYANVLTWNAGLGWYALRKSDRSIALQLVFSGETKDTDTFEGVSAEDTGLTAVYLGPQVLASLGSYSAEVGVDLPIVLDNTALQAVPDYRIRAAITFRF